MTNHFFGRRLCPFFAPLAMASGLLAADAPPVTFYRDIAPIVYQNCSTCHRPGESVRRLLC